jgi:hypothetical protein
MRSVYITPSLKICTFVKEDIITMSGGEFTTNGIYSEDGQWSVFSSD